MIGQRLLEAGDDLVALLRSGVKRHQVVVVQVHPVRAQLAELRDDPLGRDGRAHRLTKRVAPGVADRPQAKGKLVFLAGCELVRHCDATPSSIMPVMHVAPEYHRSYRPTM